MFDAECDWHLLDTCNYRCKYCYFNDDFLGRKIRVYANSEQWSNAFERTGVRWLINITGGEPTVYPGFVELCKLLTSKHFLSLNTNLSGACVFDFAETVPADRVFQINAGLHWDERKARNGINSFVRKVIALREVGHNVIVTVVATPPVLNNYEKIVDCLAPAHLYPIPKLVTGPFEGSCYPESYSEHEKFLFMLHSEAAKISLALTSPAFSAASVNPFDDINVLISPKSYVGHYCEAGRRFVRIDKDGSVHRCSPKLPLGNILHGTMTLLSQPRLCDTSYCEYYCRKYSSAA